MLSSLSRNGINYLKNTSDNANRLLVVPAANSKISQRIIPNALKEGNKVVAVTGNLEKSEQIYPDLLKNPNVQFVQMNHSDYQNPNLVSNAVKATLGKNRFHSVGVVNVLGGTRSSIGRPDSEEVLIHKNIEQPKGFIAGVLEGTKGLVNESSVINISSIAASISDPDICRYARARIAGEKAVAETAARYQTESLTHLRLGLVQPHMHIDPETDQLVLDSGHNHSAENWRDYSVVTVGGKDDLPLQQPVSLDCVAKGTLAAATRNYGPKELVIDAVSRQTMTQREYLTYFTRSKKVLCVHVPLDFLHQMTELVADGRLQPYAVNILRSLEKDPKLLDADAFEKLLGSPAKTLDEIYEGHELMVFQHSSPQLARYVREFLRTSATDPRAAMELAKAAINAGKLNFSILEKN